MFSKINWSEKIIPSLLFYLLVHPSLSSGQGHPQWDDIPAGPHDIGFKVIEAYDYSRGYGSKVDRTGISSIHETARPIQLSVWYPAGADEQSQRMAFGDYVELLASELGTERAPYTNKQEARERLRRGPLNPYYPDGVSDKDLQTVLDTPIPVIKDAKPKTGVFPLIIHAGFGLIGQSVLNEYLASYGYVVVSFPVLSTHPAWYNRGEGTMEWYQAIADDIGFIYGEMRNFSPADRSKTAVIGIFAASGFLYQMQNMRLQAIASLDGQYPEVIRKAPAFNLDKIRIPVLDMPSVNNADKRLMLDSMRFAPRYTVRFDSVQHGQFYQFRRIAHPEESDEDIAYKIIARYTKAFLDGILKRDSEAIRFLKKDPAVVGAPPDFMRTGFMPVVASPPTENEFLLMIRNGEVAKARKILGDLKKELSDYEICSEPSLRTVALFFRRDHGASASLGIFKLWTDMFPNSWRAQNQLGNIFARAGDYEEATSAFQQTIDLISQNSDLSDDEKEDYINQLNEKIEDLSKKIKADE